MNGVPYWRLSSFYFSYFALLGATAPFLALYFNYLGLSAARIGELLAIPMFMRCLAPNLWGWLGDKTGRRLHMVRAGVLLTLLCFAGILWRQDFAGLALIMALHAFFWHGVLPQCEVITLAHLREHAARYSHIRLWGSIGFMLTVVGLGALLERIPLHLYPWSVLSIMLFMVLCSLWIPEPASSRSTGAPVRPPPMRALWKQPGIAVFFAVVACMQFSHGPYYTFISVHLEQLGYERSSVGMLWALGVVAEIVLFLGMARLLARFSVRTVLGVSLLLAALRWVLLGYFAQHLGILLGAQLLHAATFGSFHAGCIHFIRQRFLTQQLGQGQTLYATLSGAGGAIGALYAGYTWNSLGAGVTFSIASAVALLAAFLVFIRLGDSADAEEHTARAPHTTNH